MKDPILGNWRPQRAYEQISGWSYSRSTGRVPDNDLVREELSELSEITTLSHLEKGTSPSFDEFDVSYQTRKGVASSFRLVRVETELGTYFIPKELEYYGDPRAVIAPDGSGTFFADDRGIWKVEYPGDEKPVNALAKSGKFGKEGYWYNVRDMIPSERGGKLLVEAMPVRTNGEKNLGTEVFLLEDNANKKQIVLKRYDEPVFLYGWINDEEFIYWTQIAESGEIFVSGKYGGSRHRLNIDGDRCDVLATQNGMLAYSECSEPPSGELLDTKNFYYANYFLKILKYKGEGKFEEVYDYKLDPYRLIKSPNGFSTDGRYYASLYHSKKDIAAQNLIVFDVQTGKIIDFAKYPDGCGDYPCINNFHWMDENTLLFTVSEDRINDGGGQYRFEDGTSNGSKVSIWKYSIEE